jgi:regulator of protease activity HflC (stomatin/prohibitin superfamily)
MEDFVGFLCFVFFVVSILAIVFFSVFRITIVEAGTAKIVLKFGAYHKTILSKTGFTIDADGSVVPGDESHFLGGLRFVGIRGIYSIFEKDKFHWVKSKSDDTLEEKTDTNVSRLLVKYYTYGMVVKNAEDKELVPTTVKLSVTAWIVNPKRAWIETEDWFSTFTGRLAPYVRQYVTLHPYKEIIEHPDRQLAEEVFQMLKDKGIIIALSKLHGIEVIAIECKDFSPEEAYRESTLKEWRAEREAQYRLGSTSGAIMAMIAQQTGMTVAEIQAEFKADPAATLVRYKGLIKMNKDFVTLQMGIDAGAVRMHEFKGGQGGLDLIALWGDVLSGGKGNQQGGVPTGPNATISP